MKELEEIDILSSIFADHNPISVLSGWKSRKFNWKLNIAYLKNEDFKKQAKEELEFFFKQNLRPETSVLMVWELSKAFFQRNSHKIHNKAKKRKTKKNMRPWKGEQPQMRGS